MTTRPDPYTCEGTYYPDPLPVAVLVGREREGRTLCVTTEAIRVFSRALGLMIPIPRGYVTDWASVPEIVQLRIQPFGRHAWAAMAHDWLYSVGEPGRKPAADRLFREKLVEAEVAPLRRWAMTVGVTVFGGGGYARAAEDWDLSFRDPRTGELATAPFARESAFLGGPNGPQPWSPPPAPAEG